MDGSLSTQVTLSPKEARITPLVLLFLSGGKRSDKNVLKASSIFSRSLARSLFSSLDRSLLFSLARSLFLSSLRLVRFLVFSQARLLPCLLSDSFASLSSLRLVCFLVFSLARSIRYCHCSLLTLDTSDTKRGRVPCIHVQFSFMYVHMHAITSGRL